MLSERAFGQLITKATSDFESCWKSVKPDPDPDKMDLIGFQPRLLRALQSLEIEYESLARARRTLVAKKAQLNTKWVRGRLRLISRRQEVLRDATTVGRTIGDSFAWLFYRDEHALLDRHNMQEFVVPIPTGIGGQGELAFVSTFPAFAGHFVLHHGITTILRLGDFSLVDPAAGRIVGIGELKTSRPNNEQLSIQVVLIWAKGQEKDIATVDSPRHSDTAPPPQLSEAALARLQRQMKRTTKAIRDEADPRDLDTVGVAGGTYTGELQKAVERARRGQWITHRAGPGLLFVVYRSLSRRFDRRLYEMSRTAAHRLRTGENPSKAVVPLIIFTSKHNSIITTSVVYGSHGRPHHPRHAWPLVWRGVDRDIAYRLITLETQVMTVYNPAHLYAAFERKGWEIAEAGTPPETVLLRREGGAMMTMHGLDWYVRDVALGLASEEQVVNVVEIGVRRVRERGITPGTRVSLDFRHIMPPIDVTDPE